MVLVRMVLVLPRTGLATPVSEESLSWIHCDVGSFSHEMIYRAEYEASA